ncbi:hypothetical protein [Aquimarina mytili]|uniref:Polymer-forming cytoskeletal protein n=1 Tax=Aquimarina mytili TaxID=874423 RepID=A0A936ZV45_9FLAO|nr:hypothetical protein [Aquimarina mytili]MBL0682746.1 hypothetical protein [Aquimarina mytili]
MKDFTLVTEEELNQRINTKSLLPSEGDYGLDCLYYKGDLEIDNHWLFDDSFYEIADQFPEAEIGTIAIEGNLTIKGNLQISDRVFCLVITGNINCENYETFETEVYLGGNLKAKTFRDNDSLTTVKGELLVEKIYKPYEY